MVLYCGRHLSECSPIGASIDILSHLGNSIYLACALYYFNPMTPTLTACKTVASLLLFMYMFMLGLTVYLSAVYFLFQNKENENEYPF